MIIMSLIINSVFVMNNIYLFRVFPFRRDHIREEQSLRICQGHPNIVRLQEVFQDDVSALIYLNSLTFLTSDKSLK